MINIFLTIIAYLLVAALTPLGVLWTFLFKISKIKNYFWNFAIALDQLGNVTCQFPMNFLFVKEGGLLHGDPDQTVSGVLGINKRDNKLKPAGKFVAFVLNKIEKNHVEKAVLKNEKA